MNELIYQEKQWNYPLFAILLLILLVQVLFLQHLHQQLRLGILMFPLLALLFGNLTVTLDRQAISWSFLWLHLPGWRIRLEDIASVEATSTRWMEGWGIKYTSTGMLYNVSGCGALRINLKNGKTLRLGTRDARRWLSYLEGRYGKPDSQQQG